MGGVRSWATAAFRLHKNRYESLTFFHNSNLHSCISQLLNIPSKLSMLQKFYQNLIDKAIVRSVIQNTHFPVCCPLFWSVLTGLSELQTHENDSKDEWTDILIVSDWLCLCCLVTPTWHLYSPRHQFSPPSVVLFPDFVSPAWELKRCHVGLSTQKPGILTK